ncbi:MAG: hypothetical protein ACR2GY_03690 [Phycisphaerales bacterium]
MASKRKTARSSSASSSSTSAKGPRGLDESDAQRGFSEASFGEGWVVDRRTGLDRRDLEAQSPKPVEGTNLERRRGPGRRRTDFLKAADEGEMTDEQFLFLIAIDTFKRVNNKTFPSWTDVLEVIRKLGYRKTMPSELNLGGRAQDWQERHDAPAGVFKVSSSGSDEIEEAA